MSILTRPARDHLSRRDIELLGSAGGYQFVTHRGREYRLSERPMGEGLTSDPLKSDEIRLTEEQETLLEGGYAHRAHVTYQGRQVRSGTWARHEADLKARQAKAVQRRIPAYFDLIPRLEIGQARGGNVVRVGPGSKLGPNVWNQSDGNIALHDPREYGLRPPAPAAMITPLVEPARTVREILERINRTGTVLVVQGGHLVASPPGGKWPRGVLEAITVLEPLIVGIHQGNPVPCAFRHDTPTEATTLLAPSCPACAQHAAG
jgi:hypothetical protein